MGKSVSGSKLPQALWFLQWLEGKVRRNDGSCATRGRSRRIVWSQMLYRCSFAWITQPALKNEVCSLGTPWTTSRIPQACIPRDLLWSHCTLIAKPALGWDPSCSFSRIGLPLQLPCWFQTILESRGDSQWLTSPCAALPQRKWQLYAEMCLWSCN